MLIKDSIEIKKRIIYLLVWFREDPIKKVEFWMKKGITKYIERVIHATENEEDIIEILWYLNDMLRRSWVGRNNSIRERVAES